jgi:multidrug efflux system membrane fusion protein
MTALHSPARSRFLLTTFALAVTSLLAACGEGGGGGPPQMPPPEVNVSMPVQKAVTEWDEYSGIVEAIDAVEIRPRVGGYLDSVNFEEGQLVQEGDLLFRIDAREFRAAAASARADVARSDARLELAKQEFARSEKLVAVKAISQGELETRQGEVLQANADKLAAKARLDQANLTLSFAEIHAPISGRIGAALIKQGNLLTPNQSLLTTVVSQDPVYVSFEGDENAYLRYQELDRSGDRASSRDTHNPVRVGLANETGFPHEGEMVFVDNAINPATGTIRARALLDNASGVFTPGLFARVRLLGESIPDALLIHEQAVLTDQDRRYVYVVGDDNTAARRVVTLGPAIDGLRVVNSGLSASDRVVVNGVRKIFFPGQPVSPLEVPMDQPNLQPPSAPAESAPASGAGQ